MRVLVFGTFDHLHPGHLSFLQQAASLGELTVAVSRDRNVERIKGKAPDQPEEERRRAIEHVVPVAKVILGDEKDFLVPVRDSKPDLILLGYDQRLPEGMTEEDLGCRVERAIAYEPEKYKSSLIEGNKEN